MNGIASLSLDLDNKWTYLKTHGDPGWETFPSYLDVVVPRALGLLSELGLTITVFVVGQDAALDANRGALSAIARAGHEIGNHSFAHEQWLHLYTEAEVEDDIAKAEAHIEAATGKRPAGFRGPGFSFSPAVLAVLSRRGYRYDASTFPTFIGPLARAYYFMTARLSDEESRRRRLLFGRFREGLRPLRPYVWPEPCGLVEVPVTTMPLLRMPFHVSYLLYASRLGDRAALAWFRSALGLCRAFRVEPSLLLHPLDFLGCDDTEDLAFFPAMDLKADRKVRLVREVLVRLAETHTVVTVARHAEAAAAGAPANAVPFRTGAGNIAPSADGARRTSKEEARA